jgi:hypothetical protein
MQLLIGKPTQRIGEFDGLEYWKDTYDRLWRMEPGTNRGEQLDPDQAIQELTSIRDRLWGDTSQSPVLPGLTELLEALGAVYEVGESQQDKVIGRRD